MNRGSTGLRRWTQWFTVASAGSFVLFLLATLLGVDHRIVVLLGLFGFVCPMIFGMAYLLLPAYVGRTLVDQRLAGIHFGLAYVGLGALVLSRLLEGSAILYAIGVFCWVLGVFVFVGSLLASVKPALRDAPARLFRSGDKPKRSTKLATAVLPIAMGYLVVGTLGFLATAIPGQPGSIAFSKIVHFYAIGFGALLVYGLGARLLIGFFHVSLPRPLVWLILLTGAVAPAFLGASLWIDPWSRVGAILGGISMTGYAALIAFVTWRAERVRVGLSGILLGAIAGMVAVAFALPVAFGYGVADSIAVHGTLVLAGFFPLTIVGYAYLFFPVSEGQFPGATPRVARAAIGLLGVGVALQTVGISIQYAPVRIAGLFASILGGVGYGYLLSRRFFE